jgi:phosphoglycolate phosphatase
MKACYQNNFYALNSPGKVMALFETNIFEAMLDFGLDDNSINRILKTFQSDIGAYQNDMRLFDGISDTLKKIAKKNKIVIITSNISKAAKQVLINNGVNCFEDVLGAEIEKSKVKKIRITMARYPGLSAYYVGDTKGDMIEGRKAGAITVAALWGWHAVKKLEEGAPDHFVRSPEALLDLLD